MAKRIDLPAELTPEIIAAYVIFSTAIDPENLVRNFSKMFFYFLQREDYAEQSFQFGDIAYEMDALFDFMQAIIESK
jgi:hypothetical protein